MNDAHWGRKKPRNAGTASESSVPVVAQSDRRRSFARKLVIIVIFFAVAFVFLFVFFLVWLLSKEGIGGNRPIRTV
jgi:flagellar biogenesis protein FliO